MSQEQRQPLALVVDDESEWREQEIPMMLEKLSIRFALASNVQDALLFAAQHDAASGDPIDVVILDMRMPMDATGGEVVNEAGVIFLRSYRLALCPVIVFTAYPSFPNCVAAMKNGASDYISKVGMPGEPIGTPSKRLILSLESFLGRNAGEPRPPVPSEEWLVHHYDWLQSHCGGGWVAFMDACQALTKKAQWSWYVQDDVAIVAGDTYESVRGIIINNTPLLRMLPDIVFVPPVEEITNSDQGE